MRVHGCHFTLSLSLSLESKFVTAKYEYTLFHSTVRTSNFPLGMHEAWTANTKWKMTITYDLTFTLTMLLLLLGLLRDFGALRIFVDDLCVWRTFLCVPDARLRALQVDTIVVCITENWIGRVQCEPHNGNKIRKKKKLLRDCFSVFFFSFCTAHVSMCSDDLLYWKKNHFASTWSLNWIKYIILLCYRLVFRFCSFFLLFFSLLVFFLH